MNNSTDLITPMGGFFLNTGKTGLIFFFPVVYYFTATVVLADMSRGPT